MSAPAHTSGDLGDTLEIIAFRLHNQEFCVRTTTIREIRGWGPATPIPHAPPDVIGIMNLRGTVIPIIDLANKLGMQSTEPTERSAIVVAEVHGMAMGLLVDRVSDILTIAASLLQPVPEVGISGGIRCVDGVIAQPEGMICFLNLEHMFEKNETAQILAA
ncbi:chemotaxis protein CheW [Agrobacterium rubi]|uniref:Purine-binding chemotaxis protein CheW n=1 Tax=Agrobacterium rubi TaxID=28099 RepID=A0AAE7R846_9HYPH|nr:chemotaxis protein CheW [Agrobacterium rubi]NTE87918.1 purine-binding chemotaxis protein CheW [Agrobacterium rubi]NTF03685.1 purine-binding chemotaxis protein CheW [Agrobacterium rubi]NTF38011.1 purine-binding chemotaxis protein CheW [Agrobacterium rubi]OCJ43537.1 chemotaxis protein CheW [Agrobacterium rubi]QTG02068.1 purine-binding chemotaxis protein CheW [Agrobacterium rubi]